MKTIARQASSFAAPFFFCIIFPCLVVSGKVRSGLPFINQSAVLVILGALICFAGAVAFVLTVRMLILIGNGTIMPWDPTHRLVTASLYGYVRNPMIMSVIFIVVGEALFFASLTLALLALIFLAVNHLYFILSEEPGLAKRFGQEYIEYKQHVPRWIPRLKPWHPE